MNNFIVVRTLNLNKYGWGADEYGILQESLHNTAVVNFSNNNGTGICINIAHEDYAIVNPNQYTVFNGKLWIKSCNKYIETDLEIY